MDRDMPWLTSMALLSSDRLVVADKFSHSVKLVDVVQDKVLHELKVGGRPCSLCSLPGNRAAVALQDKQKILIMDCANQLSIVGTIAVRGYSKCIAYSNNQLFVLHYFPLKIEILHMNGTCVKQKMLGRFNLDRNDLFLPFELSVMTEGDVTSIFVYDDDNLGILRLDEDLQEQQIFYIPGFLGLLQMVKHLPGLS